LSKVAEANPGELRGRIAQGRRLPGLRVAKKDEGAIRVANLPYAPKGHVLDYIVVPGNSADYTFERGTTYYVTSAYLSGGTVTFQAGCIVKIANGGNILQYGTLVCNSYSDSPSILTSADDDLYGEIIPGSTGNPSYAGAPALWVYFDGPGVEVKGMKIRWARTAVQIDGSESTFEDSSIELCQTGLSAQNGSTVSIINSTQCGIQTPLYDGTGYGESFAGSLADRCNGDADGDGLPDVWEVTYFGHTYDDGNSERDGDGLTNLQEYHL